MEMFSIPGIAIFRGVKRIIILLTISLLLVSCSKTSGDHPAIVIGADQKTKNATTSVESETECCECEACPQEPGCERRVQQYRGPHPGRNGLLTQEEMRLARIAWSYFERNYQQATGMVNAVDNYPSTTMWDTASYLGGLVAAHELGLICRNEFDERISTLLNTLNTLDLFRGELPNKVYNTQNGQKVDYGNKPGEIGFSALDLGRLLIWLDIIKGRYPEYAEGVDNVVLRWNFCNVLDKCGTLYGALVREDKSTLYVQEGRLGYEEYAAKGFQLWGFSTRRASLYEPYDFVPIYGVLVPYDTRDPRELTAHNYVVSESYVLDGIEFNWDNPVDDNRDDMVHTEPLQAEYAGRIYEVQKRRYERTGVLTARTEHQLDGPPYFVYDTIYTDGFAWNTITEAGEYSPEFAAIASKGAFGLWVLWETEYTDLLYDAVAGLYDPKLGFKEGRYEGSNTPIDIYTANNNGIILASLLYKVEGKLTRQRYRPSRWDRILEDEFQGNDNCFPGYEENCGPGHTKRRKLQ